MDLVNFISEYGSDFNTTVYGVGSGTMWVERVMHLNPPEVTGYVLDGGTPTSGASPDKFPYVTSAASSFSEVGDAFLALCSQGSVCNSRFKKKGLKSTIQHLITKLDKKPSSTCAKLLKTLVTDQDEGPPSFVLRDLLGALTVDKAFRTLIPPLVYRLLRCAHKDVDVLTHFIKIMDLGASSKDEKEPLSSPLLDALTTYSEMWETPTPSVSEMRERCEETIVGGSDAYAAYVPSYCAFSKEKSAVCNKLKLGNYKGNGIIYERDEYWNKTITIPDQASVLLLSSKMDPLAPNKYAEYFLDALVGDKKELITFNYATFDKLIDRITFEDLCSMTVLASFVQGNNDLDKLNKTCVEDDNSAPFNMTTPIEVYNVYWSTDNAYDGVYDASLSAA